MDDVFRCGHEKTSENTRWEGKTLVCKLCRNAYKRELHKKHRAAYQRLRQIEQVLGNAA